MSDDDLWRPKDAGPPSDDAVAPGEQPQEGVSDETQPLSGLSSNPPPTPTPSAPPPRASTYVPPAGQGGPPPQNPYAQQQNPYGGQPYAPPPNPYPPPQEYATPQSPYGSPYHPAYAGGMLPDHPSATTSMVLGIVGLVGLLFCGGITLLLSPAAWIVGAKAVREIDSMPGRYGGRDKAQSGKIMGIIGTVILGLIILAIVAFIVLAVAVSTSDPTPVTPNPTGLNG
jgi:hypothetical protein